MAEYLSKQGLNTLWTKLKNTFALKSHNHTKSQITDFPTSMPASDVYSWAKASSKPSYSWSEITNKPSTFTPASHNHDSLYQAKGDYYTINGVQARDDEFVIGDGNGGLVASGYTTSSFASSNHTHSGYASSSHTHTIGNVTGLQAALDGKAASSHTHSYLPLSGGTVTGNTSFSGTVNLASSSTGIQFNSSAYYVTNMESGSVSVTLGASNGTEASKTVSFHGGSKGSGSWHIIATAEGTYSDNVSIGISGISNTGFTIWVRNVYSASSRTLNLHYVAVKYY